MLEELRAQGSTVVLWSAGGGDYARRKAELVGIDDLIHAFYDKDERGGDGRYLVAHLAASTGRTCASMTSPRSSPPTSTRSA